MNAIHVIDYLPEWPEQFIELRSVFDNALAGNITSIEHVGSTAVPGLAAKPIIDIDIIVSDEIQLNKAIPVITLLGYQFMGEQGIKGRFAFNALSSLSPKVPASTHWPKHHLYCCLEDCVSLKNHLLFRDALRASKTLAEQYGQLKKRLALITSSIDEYVEAKSSFIADVLYQAGLPEQHIQDIINQNKKK